MICSNVDLPQPDGPMIDTKLLRAISRFTPLSAAVVPPGAANDLRTSRMLRKGRDSSAIADGSGDRQNAARNVDRRLEQTEFLHQLHGPRHAGNIDRCAELRQQHLVLERRIEAGPGLVDI